MVVRKNGQLIVKIISSYQDIGNDIRRKMRRKTTVFYPLSRIYLAANGDFFSLLQEVQLTLSKAP